MWEVCLKLKWNGDGQSSNIWKLRGGGGWWRKLSVGGVSVTLSLS